MSEICATPGCNDPVYRDEYGKVERYCRKTHKSWGEKGCIMCRRAAKFGDSKLCYPCGTIMGNVAPVLVRVPEDNETYSSIANQFRESWRHPTRCPNVQAIYSIVESHGILNRFNAYRDVVEARGRFAASGLTPGNQVRRWHGTNRDCNIGDSGRTSLCYSSECSLCCIIRASFDITLSKKKFGWGRFGNGICTSATSSKSNDYIKTLVDSPWKAMLLSHVVAGNGAKLTTNATELTEPPAGYDSVIGEPSATSVLNYDELVVYTNDAVLPGYVVMYDA